MSGCVPRRVSGLGEMVGDVTRHAAQIDSARAGRQARPKKHFFFWETQFFEKEK